MMPEAKRALHKKRTRSAAASPDDAGDRGEGSPSVSLAISRTVEKSITSASGFRAARSRLPRLEWVWKSTTMKMLVGLLMSSGTCKLFGEPMAWRTTCRQNNVGYMTRPFRSRRIDGGPEPELHAQLYHLPPERVVAGRIEELLERYDPSLVVNSRPDSLPLA